MESVILNIVTQHPISGGVHHKVIHKCRKFKQLLKEAQLDITTDESNKFEEFIAKRNQTTEKICGKKFAEETYEMLFAILTNNVNKSEICYYFHDLVDYYWKALEKKYKALNVDLTDVFPVEEYEVLVKNIWPYVKFDYFVKQLVEGKGNAEMVNELLKEIEESLRKPNLLKEDCYKIIENYSGNKQFKLQNWTLIFLEDRPGYLGDYFKINIDFETANQNQTLHLFAKCLPTTQLLPIALATFRKEDFFYNEFQQKLNEFGLNELEGIIPKCYFSRKNDVIVMEDLSLQGYQPIKSILKHSELDVALLTMKSLAKLHASSLMLEEKISAKSGKTYRLEEEYYDYLQAYNFSFTRYSGIWMTCACRHVHNYLLDKFPDIPKEISMRIFKRRAEYLCRQSFINVQNRSEFRKALNHGDLWWNNFLISCENDKLKSCLILDFQLIHYGPPAIDLLFYLYLNLTKETRTNHTKTILNQYYQELATIFKNHNLDINQVYTKQAFFESMEYYKPTCLLLGFYYAQLLMLPEEILEPLRDDQGRFERFFLLERNDIMDQALAECPKYKAKMEELVEDLYECCVAMDYP